MTSIDKFIGTEFRSRYVNPTWIEGMKKEGYAGAGAMREFVEYLWGWDATVPETVSDGMWKETFDVYVEDKHQLGMKEFFDNSRRTPTRTWRPGWSRPSGRATGRPTPRREPKLLGEYVESVNSTGRVAPSTRLATRD